MDRLAHQDRGMTLIELMVAVLVVAGLFALVVPSIQAVAGVRVKEEAGRLAGAIGYVYGHSAMMGQTCRIAFHLGDADDGGGGYQAECTEGRAALAPGEVEVRDGAAQRPDFETDPFGPDDEESLELQIKKSAQWSAFPGKGLPPMKMKGGVQIAGFWTPRHEDVVEAGDGYLYFLPIGETQEAYIWLKDPADNWYTLTVQPLTGKVTAYPENLEVPDR